MGGLFRVRFGSGQPILPISSPDDERTHQNKQTRWTHWMNRAAHRCRVHKSITSATKCSTTFQPFSPVSNLHRPPSPSTTLQPFCASVSPPVDSPPTYTHSHTYNSMSCSKLIQSRVLTQAARRTARHLIGGSIVSSRSIAAALTRNATLTRSTLTHPAAAAGVRRFASAADQAPIQYLDRPPPPELAKSQSMQSSGWGVDFTSLCCCG